MVDLNFEMKTTLDQGEKDKDILAVQGNQWILVQISYEAKYLITWTNDVHLLKYLDTNQRQTINCFTGNI